MDHHSWYCDLQFYASRENQAVLVKPNDLSHTGSYVLRHDQEYFRARLWLH